MDHRVRGSRFDSRQSNDVGSLATAGGGKYDDVAHEIKDAIGGEIAVMRPGGGAPVLGKSEHNPNGDWDHHTVVVEGGRVYDGWTGPEGASPEEYKDQFRYKDGIDFGF